MGDDSKGLTSKISDRQKCTVHPWEYTVRHIFLEAVFFY